MLQRENIPHNVLNAKQHEREAEIVARAGQKGAVTIATNMAGRGTDIKLGEGVVWLDRKIIESNITLDDYVDGKRLRDWLIEKPCGLYVIGSERHEARRIDRQLRGRCARQGDPGMSRFYVSLEDDLMRLFGSERISGVLSKMGMVEGQPLEHKWLNRSIENAQKRVEQHNYAIRRRTLQYDDVMNKQRELIYKFRGEIVRSDNVRDRIYDIFYEVLLTQAEALLDKKDENSINTYLEWVQTTFPVVVDASEVSSKIDDPEEITKIILEKVKRAYEIKVEVEDPNLLKFLEKQIILHAIDTHWQEYLRAMDALREGVGLRAYGQQDPLIEYKREAFKMFEDLMSSIKMDIVSGVFRSATSMKSFQSFITSIYQNLSTDKGSSAVEDRTQQTISNKVTSAYTRTTTQTASSPVLHPTPQKRTKVGRNDPCPCGSGKKYKKCCGK
jgi:preprotein translocase subunit SecA